MTWPCCVCLISNGNTQEVYFARIPILLLIIKLGLLELLLNPLHLVIIELLH